MSKKFFKILIILFIFLCLSTCCFAEDKTTNMVHSGVDTVSNGIKNVGNMIENGVDDLGNMTENAITDAGDTINDSMNKTKNSANNLVTGTSDALRVNDYNTSRTSSNGYSNNVNTLWVWIAVAIAAAVIIGLVWYYTSQDNTINKQ